MVSVPAQYQGDVTWAAQQLRISPAIVAAQISQESGFNPAARSGAGAVGIAQFLPSTWAGLKCSGSPANAADSFQCYATYMGQLLAQFHGNTRFALAGYLAGGGWQSKSAAVQAQALAYADGILSAAGASPGVQAGPSGGAATTSAQTTAADPGAAVWSMSIPLLGSFTILSKSQVRSWLGVGIMLAGGLFALAGMRWRALAAGVRTAEAVTPLAGQAGGGNGGASRLASKVSQPAPKPSGGKGQAKARSQAPAAAAKVSQQAPKQAAPPTP